MFVHSVVYTNIYKDHHDKDDTAFVLSLDNAAELIFDTEVTAINQKLNEHWEQNRTYSSALCKKERQYLRVAAVLEAFYCRMDDQLSDPKGKKEAPTAISGDNMKFAVKLVAYYHQQMDILLEVCNETGSSVNFYLFDIMLM